MFQIYKILKTFFIFTTEQLLVNIIIKNAKN